MLTRRVFHSLNRGRPLAHRILDCDTIGDVLLEAVHGQIPSRYGVGDFAVVPQPQKRVPSTTNQILELRP